MGHRANTSPPLVLDSSADQNEESVMSESEDEKVSISFKIIVNVSLVTRKFSYHCSRLNVLSASINQSSELGLIQKILSLGGFINVIIDNMISNSCFLLHQYLSMLDFAFPSCGGRFFRLVSFSFVCNKCK